MKPYEPIREQILRIMREQGWTVSALAEAAAMSRPGLSYYLAGSKDITTQTADRLFVALNGKKKK